MSLDDPKPQSADDSPDTPAALAPDEPTVVHDIPAVPGLGEPSAAEEITSETVESESVPVPDPAAASVPATAPEPPPAFADAALAAPPLPPTPVSDPAPIPDDLPQVTSSGLPNPHGLPEIAVERPEVAVGAAFAGGLVLAMILKRLAR